MFEKSFFCYNKQKEELSHCKVRFILLKHIWNAIWLGQGSIPFEPTTQEPMKWVSKDQRIHIVFCSSNQIDQARAEYPNAMLVVIGLPMESSSWQSPTMANIVDDVLSPACMLDDRLALWHRLARNLSLRQQIYDAEKRAKIIGLGAELLNHLHDEKEVYKKEVYIESGEKIEKKCA